MSSPFDAEAFNQRLFFPRADAGGPAAGSCDFALNVAPDVSLHARWHGSESSRATVVVFHGNGEIVADYDRYAPRYHAQVGADLAVIDFRGYGRSSSNPTFRNCIADAVPALRALKQELGARLRSPLVVLGRSLGGACAAEIAQQDPSIVDAIVMESAPGDPLRILSRRGVKAPERLNEADAQTFDPRRKLSRCKLPVLVLHGAKDRAIFPHEARENFDSVAHGRKRLVYISSRGHGDVLEDPSYYSTLGEFVRAVRGDADSVSAWNRPVPPLPFDLVSLAYQLRTSLADLTRRYGGFT